MIIVLGSLQLGILYGLLAIGIYISFRILNIPDLTAEGSFTLGLVLSAQLTSQGHPFLGIIVGLLAGACAGCVTGLLQTKLSIHPILSGILTMSGLYSVNLAIIGSSTNISLIGLDTIFNLAYNALPLNKDVVKLLIALIYAIIFLGIIIIFFKTQLGLSIRATGDNQDMVRASSINDDTTKLVALAISNGYIALTGALIAQYQNFADINSGVGILVVGLASVIIGEVIFGRRSVSFGFVEAIFGSIIYRFIIALATKYTILPAYALKLVSAIIVTLALALPAIKVKMDFYKTKKEAIKGVKD